MRLFAANARAVTVLLIFTALVALAQPTAQQEQDPGGWTKAKWGMTEEQILAALPGQAVRLTGPVGQRTFGSRVANIGVETLRIGSEFEVFFLMDSRSQRLEQVILRCKNTDYLRLFGGGQLFADLEMLMAGLYGTAHHRNPLTSYSGGIKWIFPTTIIEMSYTDLPKSKAFAKIPPGLWPNFFIIYLRNSSRDKL